MSWQKESRLGIFNFTFPRKVTSARIRDKLHFHWIFRLICIPLLHCQPQQKMTFAAFLSWSNIIIPDNQLVCYLTPPSLVLSAVTWYATFNNRHPIRTSSWPLLIKFKPPTYFLTLFQDQENLNNTLPLNSLHRKTIEASYVLLLLLVRPQSDPVPNNAEILIRSEDSCMPIQGQGIQICSYAAEFHFSRCNAMKQIYSSPFWFFNLPHRKHCGRVKYLRSITRLTR